MSATVAGSAAQPPPVLTHRDGQAGHLVLNRPRAINALTHEMVGLLHRALDDWADDDGIRTVVLTGSGERGLCAGGDIVALYQDALAGGRAAAAFWADEYRLNAAIARYPKPFVAVMDGIVLGGGIGLSAHASLRVVTERSRIGMPETGIGFLPDVGGTFLLSRAPGELGTHLALTGGSVTAGDAIAVGLADHYLPAAALPALLADLATQDAVDVLRRLAQPPPPAPLLQQRPWVDELYAGPDLLVILDRLRTSPVPQARAAAQQIAGKSPTSLHVTLRALRAAAGFSHLEQALDQEFRAAVRAHASADFVEGVRAQVIDKDRAPRWSPARVQDVTPQAVAAYFADLGPRELGLTELGLTELGLTEHLLQEGTP